MAIAEVTAEEHIQSIITERRDLASANAAKDEEIASLKSRLSKKDADLEKLVDFLPIVEKPMLSMPVYLKDKAVINRARAAIIKSFGRKYDIGDPDKDDKDGKRLARNMMSDFVEGCIDYTCKYHLPKMLSSYFPQADFRK